MKKLAVILANNSLFRKILNRFWFSNSVRVVCYHSISENDKILPTWLCVSPENFEEQIKMIKENFNVVSFEEIEKNKNLKNKLVITFDDGLKDNFEAAKILNRYGLKATFFINPPTLKGKTLWIHSLYLTAAKFGVPELSKMLNLDREFEEIKELIDYLKKSCPYQDIESKTASLGLEREINFYLDQKDLEKMKEMGMSIGSHGVSHFLFSRLDDIIKESSQDKFLEELNKKEIISFAYPFGDPISFNEAANSVLKKKYQYICTTIPSINKNKNGVMGRVCSYEMSPIKLYLKLMIGY